MVPGLRRYLSCSTACVSIGSSDQASLGGERILLLELDRRLGCEDLGLLLFDHIAPIPRMMIVREHLSSKSSKRPTGALGGGHGAHGPNNLMYLILLIYGGQPVVL